MLILSTSAFLKRSGLDTIHKRWNSQNQGFWAKKSSRI